MSDPDLTLAGASAPSAEDAPPPAYPLALEPLSPVVSRHEPSPADPLSLDPLGPLVRFASTKGTT
jgi:hypothetical protein